MNLPLPEMSPANAAQIYLELGFQPVPVYGINADGSCQCGSAACAADKRKRGKHPIGAEWQLRAPQTKEQAAIAFADHRGNLGLYVDKTPFVVLDFDGPEGADTLAALTPRATLRARSGSGGTHLFYRLAANHDASEIPDRSKIRPGMDVKKHGQVLAAPSRHVSGGSYSWVNDEPIATLPDELYIIIRKAPYVAPVYEMPRGDMVVRARAYLATMDPGIQGEDGSGATFKAARKLVQDFRLPDSLAWSLLCEFNERCLPPWSESELCHKFKSAKNAHTSNPVQDRPYERGGRAWNHSGEPIPEPAPSAPAPGHSTFASVIRDWTAEGPLVHQPTHFPSLDRYTNGGIVYGSRVYLMGAPDAGKTAMLIQLAHQYAEEGICVGLLAVDEEPGDVVTRFAQRSGWSRDDCEVRESRMLEHMAEELSKLPIRFYGDEHTIESAADDLATWAATLEKRAFFGVDSIQTVRCVASADADGPRELVTANVRAVRSVTTKHRLLTVATSEMGRSSYRNQQQALQQDDMAAGKESGAIEYSARVLLALRTVKGQPGLVNCKVVKNKLGDSPAELHMQLDKRRQKLTECEGPEELQEVAHPHLADDCARLLAHIASKGSIKGQRGTRAFFATEHVGRVRADMALDVLIESGQVENVGTKQDPKCTLKT